MSTATVDQLSAALVAALQQDHGAGVDPGLDLSGTGVVLRGQYPSPPGGRLPFASVSGVGERGERARGMGLTEWGWEHRWTIRAWIPVTSLDLDARVVRAEAALRVLLAALCAAADAAGNALRAVPDLTFEAVTLDADLEASADAAELGILVSCRTSRPGGP